MRFNKLLFIALILVIAFGGCRTFKEDGRISQGIIEYEVSYPKLDASSILTELLPTKMTLSFKDNNYMTDLSAGFGMFRMNVISSWDQQNMAQMVKLINEKYVVIYNEEAAVVSNKAFPEIKLEQTGKTKKIAGYQCKEVIATVMTVPVEKFSVYWTDEIHLDHANWFTQFAQIEGVLMEYQVERYNLCTRFQATKVSSQEMDAALFEIPETYKEIQESQMNIKMEEIFNSFGE